MNKHPERKFSDRIGSAELSERQIWPPKATGNFALNADDPAEVTVYRMALSMLRSARQYEYGMIDDIDTEFVHQYRVNLRKSRSLISLFKKALSTQRYRLLKTELKILGNSTNDLRDLDVFLLNAAVYRKMLPEDLQAGLTEIFKRVKRRRKTALKQVVAELTSDSYQQQVEQLFQALQSEPEFCAQLSRLPIRSLVCKKVLAQYQKICNDGGVIDAETPDQAIHQLRIECKKLRYLLELFGELFAPKPLKKLVGQLKKLQDNLGQFNDYAVQRALLMKLGQGRRISPEQLASIHGLTAGLYYKQGHERGLVVENIAAFTLTSVREIIQQLFNHQSSRLKKNE